MPTLDPYLNYEIWGKITTFDWSRIKEDMLPIGQQSKRYSFNLIIKFNGLSKNSYLLSCSIYCCVSIY